MRLEAAELSLHAAASEGGVQVRPRPRLVVAHTNSNPHPTATLHVQVLSRPRLVVVHGGAIELTLYPLGASDVALFLYPENVLADRWNGSIAAADAPDGESPPPCRAFHLPASFPSTRAIAERRYPLLARGVANRVSLSLEAGDALLIPRCIPHAISTAAAALFATAPADAPHDTDDGALAAGATHTKLAASKVIAERDEL